MAQFATVSAINGNGTVYAVNAQGVSRVLRVGDALQKGETVRTVGDVTVELAMEDGRLLAITPAQDVLLDDHVTESAQLPSAEDSAISTPQTTAQTITQALERGGEFDDALDPTAAGLAPGGSVDSGNTFVRLLRIVEPVEPLAYDYSFQAPAPLEDIRGAGDVFDDHPTVSLALAGSVMTDETTDLNITKTAQVVDIVAQTGQNSLGATVNVALIIDNADSGLKTTDGHAITLVQGDTDNQVVGMFDSNGDGVLDAVAFTVSISDAGVLSVTQIVSLSHPDPATLVSGDTSSYDEAVTLADKLSVAVTVVDGDGDVATQSVPVGNQISFEDDGPMIDVGLAGAAQMPSLTTQDADTIGNAVDVATSQGSFASLFTINSSMGADEGGTETVRYTLSIAEGKDVSGLTSEGAPITLAMNGNDVVGSTTAGEVFRISVDASGNVTLTQSVEIDHLPEDLDATNDNANIGLAAGTIVLTATATLIDGDQDKVTDAQALDISGAFSFDDAVPSVTAGAVLDGALTLTTQDAQTIGAASDTASASFAAAFLAAAAPVYGADGPGTTAISGYTLAITGGNGTDSGLDSNGLNITLSKVGSDVVGSTTAGEVFRISVDTSGNVTLTQSAEIDHLPEDLDASNDNTNLALAAGKVTLSATATVTDGDNDTATATVSADLGGNISFDDDMPSASAEALQNVDEGTIQTGQLDYVAGADGASVTHLGSTALSFGSDGYSQEVDIGGGFLKVTASGAYSYRVPENTAAGTDSTTFTVTDGDNDTVTQAISFAIKDANVPTAGTSAAAVDDDGLPTGNAASTNGDLVVTPDPDANEATFSGTLAFTDGGDIPVVIGFAGMDGQTAMLGQEQVTYSWNAGSNTLTATTSTGDRIGTPLFTVQVTNTATGTYTVNLLANVEHAVPGANTENDATVSLNYSVVDSDSSPAVPPGTLNITFDDDMPSVLNTTDLIYANANNNGVLGGTGVFDYAMGADSRTTYSASNSDFSTITLNGSVGANAILNPLVTFASENPGAALFDIAFDYAKDPAFPGALTHVEGTLSFDKAAGTYTVVLDSPIASYSILETSAGLSFVGYQAGTATPDNSQPDVAVTQLAADFFVQFKSYAEPGSGTGALNLYTSGDGTAGTFATGDLIVQSPGWVSATNASNGVNGDTMGGGEVLDFNFHSANPYGNTAAPSATATSMFLKFDGIVSGGTANADMTVILKLVDPDDGSTRTTRAIVIDGTDIYKQGDVLPTGYNVSLDNNDGVVFIESNDYNLLPGENWVIEGAQVLSSTEGISGTGINLDASHAASTTYQEFEGTPGTAYPEADTVDNDGFKISNIGITTQTSLTQDANLSFVFNVLDTDGDAAGSQTLNVMLENSSTFTGTFSAESITGDAFNNVLIGGGGSDTMLGGLGSDVFKWNLSETGTDTIKDFNLAPAASGGDVLDLQDLLVGESYTAASLDAYLNFSANTAGQTVITVDANGAIAGGAGQSIVLENIQFADLQSYAGGTGSDLEIITKLLADGNLKQP